MEKGHHCRWNSIPPNSPKSILRHTRKNTEEFYDIAKDRYGCRALQSLLADATKREFDMIFRGLIGHVDLMVNPFANFLIQKLLDGCDEDQRLTVVRILIHDPMVLLAVCLNHYGTRVIQKLISTLRTHEQVVQITAALKPVLLYLFKDLNGNYIIQSCLECLPNEYHKFIFDTATKHCVEIATDQHGCCIMKHCILHSIGECRAELIEAICANALVLAQDPYGNYVINDLLQRKDSSAVSILSSRFKGNYAVLSMQKFSSNVVEKCLEVFPYVVQTRFEQARIVFELISYRQFQRLLTDPYANYVIRCALINTKGSLNYKLIEAIGPHIRYIRNNPHSKRICNWVKHKR